MRIGMMNGEDEGGWIMRIGMMDGKDEGDGWGGLMMSPRHKA